MGDDGLPIIRHGGRGFKALEAPVATIAGWAGSARMRDRTATLPGILKFGSAQALPLPLTEPFVGVESGASTTLNQTDFRLFGEPL